MSDTVIRVEGLSKYYRLGLIGRGTLREDVDRLTRKLLRKSDPLLNVQGALSGRKQGEIWALSDVNFEVQKGEILGIIGRNGAGKSTLLKILSKITAPTHGTVKLKGRVGSLLEVGTGFHEQLTGRENVFLNGAILGMTRHEVSSKLEEIIEFAEMQQFIDTPVKRYSSGMRVRLAFSVAAHLEPEVLIIDEVLAVGDIAFQNKCIGKMESVANQGRTVLFVSHNMSIVQNLCTRGIIIDQGSVAFDGPIRDATNYYMSNGGKPLELEREVFLGPLQHNIKFQEVLINDKPLSDNLLNVSTEGINIRLSGECKTAIKDAEVFVAIFSEGFRLATIFDEEHTSNMNPGQFCSKFTIPKDTLRPGNYTIKIGAQSPRLKEWMISDFIGGFDISPTWSDSFQERKVGAINIINKNGGRSQ